MRLFSNWHLLWQKKPENQLGSLEITKDGFVSQPERILSKVGLLRSSKEVMLNVFIDCYCHEIYGELGEGEPSEIAEAWQELLSEWGGLMKNNDSDYLLDLSFQVLNHKKRLTYVEFAVFYLERRYDREIIDRLINEGGYDGEYPEDDRDAYLKQLSRVMSLSKTHAFQLGELNDELERLQKNSEGKKMTEDDFERNILRLSKYQGYRINKFKTSVFEYAHIHNNFIEEVKNSDKKPPDI